MDTKKNAKLIDSEADEQKKIAESRKFTAEAEKFLAESRKLNGDYVLERFAAKRSIKASKTMDTLAKMMFLSDIMTSTYSIDSNLGNNRLFNDDDLIEYKSKMKQLLKQL